VSWVVPHITFEPVVPLVKFVPLTVSVNAAEPAIAEVELRLLMVGAAAAGDGGALSAAVAAGARTASERRAAAEAERTNAVLDLIVLLPENGTGH
jgi:hypothetical protein